MSKTCELLKSLKSSGMTQGEITRQTGIPQPRLSRWSRGDVAQAADDALRLKELADQVKARLDAGVATETVASATV